MNRRTIIYVLLCVTASVGCTSPVVEDNLTREQRLWQLFRQIRIDMLHERPGQILQQELEARFNALGKPAPHRYNLAVSLSTKDISHDRRRTYQTNAAITLRDKDSSKTVFTAQASGSSRYVSTGSGYQKEKSRNFAMERSLNQLAQQIQLQLQNYFISIIEVP